jgi:hypothetical protein
VNTKKFEKNNVVNTRSQEFYSDFDVYVHMVAHGSTWYTSHFTHSLLAFKHFPFRGTNVCIPLWEKSLSVVCSQEVTA